MKSKKYKNRTKKKDRLLFDHVVFHCKYNRKMLVGEITVKTKQIISEIIRDLKCEVIELNVQPNHVHLLVGYPPSMASAKIVQKVKGISSTILRKQFPELIEKCPKALWSSGVHHSSVGNDIHQVRKYIKYQSKHHN